MNNKKARRIRATVVRDLTTLENALKRALLSFYNKYIKGSQYPVELLKQQYSKQIRNLIQSTIQKSYIKGMELVGKSIKIPDFEILISSNDLNNIDSLSKKMEDSFWRTSQRLLMRETEFKVVNNELEQKDPFDKNAAMVATSALIVYSALNNAVVSKEQELGGNNKVQFTTANDSHVDPTLCKPKSGEIYDANNVPPDSNPPLHRHCRCTLIPVV